MSVAKTRSELGRSNLSRGKAWMYDFTAWLRPRFPGAEVIAGNGRADIGGLTDWTIELKNVADEYKLPAAVDQAVRDQAARGTRWHVVIKKTARRSPGRGLAVMEIEQWAEIAGLLDSITTLYAYAREFDVDDDPVMIRVRGLLDKLEA